MNDRESFAIDMFDVVKKICTENMVELSAYVPFNAVYADFEALLAELQDARLAQYDLSKGLTTSKQKRRVELEKATFVLSSKLCMYAKMEDIAELERRSKYSPSKLKLAMEKELGGICHQLMKDANAHLPGLAPFGVDAAWMLAYEARVDAFMSLVGAPKSAIADTKKATADIKRLIPAISDLLRHRLDLIMSHFYETNNYLYGIYKAGRKIVQQGSHPPDLKGKVTDTEGKPLKGLRVMIAKTTRKSITSDIGNFRFKRLADGKYTLIVKEKKKEVGRQEVTVPGEVEIVVNAVS